MIFIFQILYALVILILLLLSSFIVFHLAKYSYDKKAAFLMIVIFLALTSVLVFSNVILFLKLPLDEIFSFIL